MRLGGFTDSGKYLKNGSFAPAWVATLYTIDGSIWSDFGGRMKQTEDLKVFISTGDRDSSCCECGEALGCGAWINLLEGKGVL